MLGEWKTTRWYRFFFKIGNSLFTSRETALLGSTTLPSTLCGLALMASSTSLPLEYVTKPKPRDRLLLGSLITCKTTNILALLHVFHNIIFAPLAHIVHTTQSVSDPHCSKWALKLSSVVSKLKPPMNSFLSCSGSLESRHWQYM